MAVQRRAPRKRERHASGFSEVDELHGVLRGRIWIGPRVPAVLPRSLAVLEGAALEVRSLRPAVHLPVALIWRRERNGPPAARAFIEFVRRET
jgi:DNA-binding transcriptional LysR family regulator